MVRILKILLEAVQTTEQQAEQPKWRLLEAAA